MGEVPQGTRPDGDGNSYVGSGAGILQVRTKLRSDSMCKGS